MSVSVEESHTSDRCRGRLFYGWVIAIVCFFSRLVKCQGQNNIMTYTVPHLLKDLNLTDGELGVLFSIGTICSSTVQPCFGRAVDRLGARICVPFAHLALCVTLIGFSAVQALSTKLFVYTEVVAVFFFIRALCLGALETFSSACLQKWFVRYRGRALSAVTTAQWLGIALMGLLFARLVQDYGWRTAAGVGALGNLIMTLLSALFLRSVPEDCGLLPDGDERAPEVICKKQEDANDIEEVTLASLPSSADERLPSLWPFYLFSFFFSVVYSASDFYMIEIIAENTNGQDAIDVAGHIFAPLAFICGSLSPVLGEAMDRVGSKAFAYFIVGFAGLAAGIATIILSVARTPGTALFYAALRGITFSIYMALVQNGVVFATMGVTADRIGEALGKNLFAGIAGTGVGPLCFGIANDVERYFWLI